MVVVHETRQDGAGRAYGVTVPIAQASDAALDAHVADTLRAWMARRGVPSAELSNADLLAQLGAMVLES